MAVLQIRYNKKNNMTARLAHTQNNCTIFPIHPTNLTLPNCMHSIISPIPTYPKPSPTLEPISEISEEIRDHSNGNQTIDHTMTFQQISNFQKWQEPPCGQCKIEVQNSQDYIQLPHSTRKVSTAQNLKNISRYIRNLVQRNINLTIKQLSYLLYQIIGETSFGKQLIYQEYLLESPDILIALAAKYANEWEITNADQNMIMIIKNVRRRLYDAINVLIAAGVLEKGKSNMLRMVDVKERGCSIPKLQEGTFSNGNLLKYELRSKLNKVERKRHMLQEMKEKQALILKLHQRNTTHQYSNALNKTPIINLPVMVVDMVSKMHLSRGGDWLSMMSVGEIVVRNDMDVLGTIFKEENNEWLLRDDIEGVIEPF